ncbi:hypothetical protein GPJ55_22605 [Bacillus subtilis]|nr:hypothetical protein GPJ55_22605 [Bacillus subtilis]
MRACDFTSPTRLKNASLSSSNKYCSSTSVPNGSFPPEITLDIQDNKMVDEGAMTSVHYFNEARQ